MVRTILAMAALCATFTVLSEAQLQRPVDQSHAHAGQIAAGERTASGRSIVLGGDLRP